MKDRKNNQKKEHKKTYEAPSIEVYDVKIENGFALSGQNERFDEGDELPW